MGISLLSLCLIISKAQAEETHSNNIPNTTPSSNEALVQCNIIFEQRKDEIALQIQDLEEKKHSLKLLQKASDEVFAQRENEIQQKLKQLEHFSQNLEEKQNQMNKEIQEKEEKIKKLITQNKEILQEILSQTQNKIAQTYAKMKDSKAAAILSDLPYEEAANILFLLKAQEASKILGKMESKKAANLTQILKKGPPFKEENQAPNKQDSQKDKDAGVPARSTPNSPVKNSPPSQPLI